MEQLGYCAIAFCLGYIVSSLDSILRILKGTTSESFVSHVTRDQRSASRRKVTIDDSKYVTDVSTDGLEASGAEIGIKTTATDDITAASNKLAQLKKLKG